MDIYSKKSRWKLYLAVAGVVIVIITTFYTNYLTNRLAEEELKKVEQFEMAFTELSKPLNPECEHLIDVTIFHKITGQNTSIPIILVSETGILEGYNFREEQNNSQEFLKSKLAKLKENGQIPIKGFGYASEIYFENSNLLTSIKYFPILQFLLIGAFVLFGYLAFSSARRAEENRVWVGMAKETAHQLGTPISGIIGWLDYLDADREEDSELQDILTELRKDVNRLELVADRFSKIGSAPKLEPVNVYQELDKLKVYMERRSPRKVTFEFPHPNSADLNIHINPHLFDWVIENLMRNALDAMEGKGKIGAEVYEDQQFVYIDIFDSGKGIPTNKHKTVFRPGFTTKKRGWGLGLSLAKRIIVEYHNGKIFVKKSVVGEGTTFTIQLPKQVTGD